MFRQIASSVDRAGASHQIQPKHPGMALNNALRQIFHGISSFIIFSGLDSALILRFPVERDTTQVSTQTFDVITLRFHRQRECIQWKHERGNATFTRQNYQFGTGAHRWAPAPEPECFLLRQ